nr:MAG TPA: conotoxin [Caudoviricetes sp.]
MSNRRGTRLADHHLAIRSSLSYRGTRCNPRC